MGLFDSDQSTRAFEDCKRQYLALEEKFEKEHKEKLALFDSTEQLKRHNEDLIDRIKALERELYKVNQFSEQILTIEKGVGKIVSYLDRPQIIIDEPIPVTVDDLNTLKEDLKMEIVNSFIEEMEKAPKPIGLEDINTLKDDLKKEIDANIQTISDSIRSEMKQGLESNQTVMSEISKLNESTSRQAESTNTILKDLKTAISNNSNSSNFQKIETKLEEVRENTGGIWGYLEEIGGIKSKLDKILEIPKETVKESISHNTEKPKKEVMEDKKPIESSGDPILNALTSWKSVKEVADETGIVKMTVRRRIEKMIEEGKIKAKGENPTKYIRQ